MNIKKRKMKTNKALVLAFALLLIQLVWAVDTVIEVPNQNFPPSQLQNVPDQSWPMNRNITDAFDLDDYFIDYEDVLTFSFANVSNITIIINSSTNVVSFYSDINFSGERNVTFFVSDGFTQIQSNVVLINVTTDYESPVWHMVNISTTNISQNTVVTFSANWTDNIALSYFVFSINEGGGWVDYNQSFTGRSNISSYTLSITAPGGTNVLWLFYAYDSSGNYNFTDTQFFTVNSPPTDENNEDNNDDSSSSTSRARGGNAPAITQRRPLLKGFEVIPDNLAIELKQGESITKLLKINNLGLRETNFTIKVEGLDEILYINENNISIKSGSSAVLGLLFKTTRKTVPDIYFGKVIINTLTERIDVPVTVTVNPLLLDFEVKLQLEEEYKTVNPGEEIEGKITLINRKDLLYENITLYYSVMNFFGELIDYGEEEVNLSENRLEFTRNLSIPLNAEPGDYIFYVRATKDNKVSMDLEEFIVGQKFNLFSFIIGNIIYIIIAIIFIITLLLFVYYHRTKEKERLLNLYIMINELKKLVEENRMEEAIMQYNRIKIAYHEKIDKTEEQNKEEIKKEMQELILDFNALKNVKKLKQEIDSSKKVDAKEESKEEIKENPAISSENKEEINAKPKEEVKNENTQLLKKEMKEKNNKKEKKKNAKKK